MILDTELVDVKRVRDAQGARCVQCGAVFMPDTCPYWHWRRSRAMHVLATGHEVRLFRLVVKPMA